MSEDLQAELDRLDAKYAEAPSQKLLNERLDLLIRMMRRK